MWVTEDLSLQRSVAAKVLRPELAGDERFLADLRAEARTSAPLAHPNIAALYDYGEDSDGSGYLVMELVSGETLADVLAREHTLAAQALLPVLAQAARALHAAHVAGVVHRDVKPSNILITPDGRVKITDFGISVGTQDRPTTPVRTVLGTAHYISPEQALGRDATPASDVYALGVVAFEAAAGHRPFCGGSLVDVAHAHVHQPVPDMPDHVPEPLRDLVYRMLAKHPERRPRSAAAVARSLERIARELELARPFEDSSPLAQSDDPPGPRLERTTENDRDEDTAGDGADARGSLSTASFARVDRPGRGRRRPRHRQSSPPRARAGAWLVAAAVVISAVLGIAAYRLAESARGEPLDAVALGRPSSQGREVTMVGDDAGATTSAARHHGEVEGISW